MDMIKVEHISKKYKTFELKDVTFSLPKGHIMGFVGENGAGKTTTIKSMLNLLHRETGHVYLLGQDIDKNEHTIKEHIGYVSGDIFFPKHKIKDVTRVYKRFYKMWDEPLYQKYLLKFNLDAEKRIDELSKGMTMKYMLTLALSHHAQLLILDEPTTGLDPVARDELLTLFQQLVAEEEISIFYSTHITTDLEKCADYILVIKDGEIIENQSKDDLIDSYRVVQGSKDSLKKIQSKLISFKENAFGFNGLIKTEDMTQDDQIRYGKPSIDDILVYFARRGEV